MRVETLFVDAGGVLVFPNWERVQDTLKRHGLAVDARRMAAAEPLSRRETDTAEAVAASTDRSRVETYWKRIFVLAGIPLGPPTEAARNELEEYHARHNLWESVPGDVAPALRRLRGQGLRLAVISNSNGTLRAKLDRLGLTALFDLVVDSTEEGVEKPDPRIFELALERLGAHAGKTVHVGDLYHVDVAGARAAGIVGVLLDPLGLYPNADCRRFSSLSKVADALAESAL